MENFKDFKLNETQQRNAIGKGSSRNSTSRYSSSGNSTTRNTDITGGASDIKITRAISNSSTGG